MIITILAFGVIFSQEAFGQKEIVGWKQGIKSKNHTESVNVSSVSASAAKTEQTPRSSTNKLSDAGLGVWITSPGRSSNLIDTSTGEVVWVDEVRSAPQTKRSGRTRNLIDTSTGEVY